MLTEFGGKPVEGGTLPASIFATFMSNVLSDLEKERDKKKRDKDKKDNDSDTSSTVQEPSEAPVKGTETDSGSSDKKSDKI